MRRKKGVILSYILMLFEVLSTLLLTPLVIKSLGPSEYGVYKLSASIIAYLALLDLGVGNAVIRFVAKFKANNDTKKMNQFLGVIQIFFVVVAFISLIGGIILAEIFPAIFAKGLTESEIALGKTLLYITTINTTITLLTAPYLNIIIGYGMFGISKGSSIIQIVTRVFATYIALSCGLKSIAIVTINLTVTLMFRFAMAFFVFYKLKLRPILHEVDKLFIKEIVGYSGWIFLQMVATQLNAYADQVLLGVFVPGSSVIIGVYSVGAQIVQYFQTIGGAVSGVLMPSVVMMVESGANSEEFESEMIRIGRFSLMILAVIFGGFLVFGRQFIHLWAGIEYLEGYYVAVILMFAWMIIYSGNMGSQILWAKNEHKEQAILKITMVLMNLIITVLLIKWKPLIGATIGTFISLIIGDIVVMNILFKKKIGISIKKYYISLFKGIIPAVIISSIVAFIFKLIGLSGWMGFIVNILFYCIVSLIMFVICGFNKLEKQYFLNIFNKCLKWKNNEN